MLTGWEWIMGGAMALVLAFLVGWQAALKMHTKIHGCAICTWDRDRGMENLKP